MELLRALGRGEAFELLGTAPGLARRRRDRAPLRLHRGGVPGADRPAARGVRADRRRHRGDPRRATSQGINEYIADGRARRGAAARRLRRPRRHGARRRGRPTDVVAVVSIVRALFGAGGGAELNNAAVLAGLVARLRRRAAAARSTTTSATATTPTARCTPRSASRTCSATRRSSTRARNALGVDAGQRRAAPASSQQLAAAGRAARIKTERLKLRHAARRAVDLSQPAAMSNHLVVGASRSATGHPILIGGPQAGYFSPQILMDYELHSPTIHARGAGLPRPVDARRAWAARRTTRGRRPRAAAT